MLRKIKITNAGGEGSIARMSSEKPDLSISEKLQRGILINEFDSGSVTQFREVFDDLNLNPQIPYIPIYIDSYGGDCYSLFAMLDIIQSAQKPVVTIAFGKAMSCGALLLSLGGTLGYRFATRYCTIMLHDIASQMWGKLEEMRSDFKETERLANLMFDLLDDKCKKKKGYFKNLFAHYKHTDIYMTTEDAKKHNLIDQIGYPIIVPNFQVDLILPENTTTKEEEPEKEVAPKTTKRRGRKKTKNVS